MSNWLFRVSKTARSVDTTRALRRSASLSRELHNMNVGAVYFRGLVTFDPSVIRINWKRINQHPLVRAGNLVRYAARQSIRDVSARRRPKPSPVGTPPRSRVKPNARGGTNRPFKMIFSVPNMLYTSVMVGMVGFNPRRPVPGVHEHGLSINQEIRVKKAQAGAGARRVVYTKRSRRGKLLHKTRYVDRRVLHYPVRPFMMPALIRKRAEFPSLWNYTTNPNMPKGLPSAYPTMWGTSVSR